ncbi:ankyrin repeat-containing domain protein [Tribonema minus]|uniref:Ankyrin repeat-containing domain protein n=1 Tax=Tribonema minus TaxID=303371 RepID=A0A835Z6Q1_9STRA|nr:ankyrin repeat-containing domain protein [Tribonema minus]
MAPKDDTVRGAAASSPKAPATTIGLTDPMSPKHEDRRLTEELSSQDEADTPRVAKTTAKPLQQHVRSRSAGSGASHALLSADRSSSCGACGAARSRPPKHTSRHSSQHQRCASAAAACAAAALSPRAPQALPPLLLQGSVWGPLLARDAAGVMREARGGADVEARDAHGRTPLMAACAMGDAHGRTPLIAACAMGDADVVRFLIRDASPPAALEATAVQGWTPLMIACSCGFVEVAKELLQAGASVSARDTLHSSTPLMWACAGGHVPVVRHLLGEKGGDAQLWERNAQLWTPLMVAADVGHALVVRLLVGLGAQVDAFGADGRSALDLAVARHCRMAEMFLRHAKATTRGDFCDFWSALAAGDVLAATTRSDFWSALASGDVAAVSRAVKGNPHMAATRGPHGGTPLAQACLGGDLAMARFLVREAGVDVNAQDSSGSAALDVAAAARAAQVNAQDSSGSTALDAAVAARAATAVRYLAAEARADVRLSNCKGWTPLMQAAATAPEERHGLEMLEVLVEAGSDINAINADGLTVLDIAAQSGRASAAAFLAAHGALTSDAIAAAAAAAAAAATAAAAAANDKCVPRIKKGPWGLW